jgi:transglutaminase-like putative cysteine protease
MLIQIRHTTIYRYAGGARYSIQALRLSPRSFAGQRVLSWSIDAPGLEPSSRFVDGFGNEVVLAAFSGAHDETVIVASGEVETFDTTGVLRDFPEAAPLRVFLRETAKTRANEDIRALAEGSRGGDTLARMHDLMRCVHQRVRYEIGATHEHTSAAEALADGKGVCQDHAHIFIAAARVLGIPARYVNGYFLLQTEGPSEAHHAWAEAYVEGLGWVGFDAANGICPTDHYVRLATGLDAASAAPIRGMRRGGEDETLDVVVEVAQQGAQQ